MSRKQSFYYVNYSTGLSAEGQEKETVMKQFFNDIKSLRLPEKNMKIIWDDLMRYDKQIESIKIGYLERNITIMPIQMDSNDKWKMLTDLKKRWRFPGFESNTCCGIFQLGDADKKGMVKVRITSFLRLQPKKVPA